MFTRGYFKNRAVWAYRGATAASIISFAAYYLPHTVFLKQYREFMASYRDGFEAQLSDKILYRFDKACELLQLKERESKLVKPFCTFGLDLYYAGTTKSHFGAVVGIPMNYIYNSEEEIDRPAIKLQTESIKWRSPEGELLAKSLILTEDEQIYGIAHTILMTHNYQRLLNASYAAGTILSTYTLGHIINQKMQLLGRPFIFRGVLYTILMFFGYGMWALLKDATHVYFEGAADDALSSISPEVADSGVRFYGKVMDKNKALRAITKKATYSTEGDICYMIRTKSFPFTARKAMLEAKLKEFREKKEEIVS